MKIKCEGCTFLRKPSVTNIAGQEYKYTCDGNCFYHLPANEDKNGSIENPEGKILYADSHIEHFWKKRILCFKRMEWLLFRLVPLFISFVAIGISIYSVIDKEENLYEALECKCKMESISHIEEGKIKEVVRETVIKEIFPELDLQDMTLQDF